MAEAVFIDKVRAAGLEKEFRIDSAGTGDWHAGQLPDVRTIKTLQAHGIAPASRARQVTAFDFEVFDLIVAMDIQNQKDLAKWPGAAPEKIRLMMSFDRNATSSVVPDPYYGDMDDFEHVYRLVNSACDGLLEYARAARD